MKKQLYPNVENIENNKLFAKFLGWKIQNAGKWVLPDVLLQDYLYAELRSDHELEFDSDYNWLMLVVEYIENLGCSEIMGRKLYSRFNIEHNHIQLNWSKDNGYQIYLEVLPSWKEGRKNVLTMSKLYKRIEVSVDETKMNALYITCLEFIKWYNENIKKATV